MSGKPSTDVKHSAVLTHEKTRIFTSEVAAEYVVERTATSGGESATGLRSSADVIDPQQLRGSAERLDEVVMSESTGTVGLIFIEQKDGIVVLMCVHQGSAEEDGRVKSGDRVVSIDGTSTSGMSLANVKKMVVGPAGTWVNFVFMRGEKGPSGQSREVMVPVDLERKAKAKVENSSDRIFTLEREKLVLIERNRYLQTQLSTSQDEASKSSSALRKSSASVEEIAILQKQLKEMEARSSASAAAAASAGEEVALLNRKLKEAAALMAKETARANELAEKLIRSGAFTEQALRESNERNESQARAHQQMQRENIELRTKLAAAVAEVTRVNQLCAEAHADAEDAIKRRENVDKDLEAARNEIKTIRTESNANAKTISELLNEISGLTSKLQDRGGQTSPTRDTEVQSLKQLCALHESKIASLTQQLEQYQASQLAKKSSSSSFDAASHPVAISMQKHIDQLSAEKQQAEQTIVLLQQDLHASQTENAQRAGHEKQVKTLTDLCKTIRQQLADAKAEIDHLQASNRIFQDQIQLLQSNDQTSSRSLQSSMNEDSLQQALRVANEYREKSDAQFKAYQASSEQAIADLKRDLLLAKQNLDAKEVQLQQQAVATQSRSFSTHSSSHNETSTHLKSEHVVVTNITRVAQLANGETDVTVLQRMLEEAQGRIIELELMINKMREEHRQQYKSLSMKVQASEDLSVKFRRDHASSETLLMDAKQEISGLRPRYDAVLAKLSSLEPQFEQLRVEYSIVTSRLSVSETRCSELSTASEGLRARLTVAEQMCGSLSDEGSALKVFISKLQSQLSDALSEAHGLRGTSKSLEAKLLELMSETQMYRGQIDELQSLLLCSKDQQRSLSSEAQAKADQEIAELKALLATANCRVSEEQVKFSQECNSRQHLEMQLKDSGQHNAELGLRIRDLDSSNRQLQERLTLASQQILQLQKNLDEERQTTHSLRSAELKQQQEVQHYRRLNEGSNDSLRVLTQENVSIKSQLLELQTRLAESAALIQHQQAQKGTAYEKMQSDLANATRMIRTLEQDIESLQAQLSSERIQRVSASERIIQLEKASEGMVTAQAFEDAKLQVASSIQQYTILQEQLRRLEHDNKRVKDLLEAEKRDSALMAVQNQKLLKDIQTADSEVSQYREQRDTLMVEISSHKTVIVTYDGRFTDMQRQINMLHGALQAERKDNDEMRSLLQDSREQVIKLSNVSFSNSGEVDDSKERQAIQSLHNRLVEKEEECLSLKKLLQTLQSGRQEQTASLRTVAPNDSSSLQLEISEAKKMIASVQAENEILLLQLQSAHAQLRQNERIFGTNYSSTLHVDSTHIISNGSTSSNSLVSTKDTQAENVIAEKSDSASSLRPSSGSFSDGISGIGSFFGSVASRVQTSVVQAASSVTTAASSVTSAASSLTAPAFSDSSASVVSSSSVSRSTHTTSSSVTVASVSISKGNSSQVVNDSNGVSAAPDVVGTGLFITSSKSQDDPVRYQHLIQSILKGSPASFVDSIQPNDILLQVDNVDVSPYPTERVRMLIVGKPGTSVSLVFARAGLVTLTRAQPRLF